MRRATAILMGVYLMADLSVGQVQNILNNGGFETGMMCYSEWAWSHTTNDFNSTYQFRLSTDAHSGSNSMEINCAGTDCLKAAIFSDRIQTPPGQSYKLNLYAKCPAGRSAFVYIQGTSGGDTYQYLTCNDAWAPNQVSFTSGPSATDFFFYIFNADTSWLRVDDLVLAYADGTVPSQPVLHAGTRNVAVSGQKVNVDGAPYFARGFFDVAYDDLPLAVAAGANTVHGLSVNMAANLFQHRAGELSGSRLRSRTQLRAKFVKYRKTGCAGCFSRRRIAVCAAPGEHHVVSGR